MAYASVTQLRAWMALPPAVVEEPEPDPDPDDLLLSDLLDTATARIDEHCGRTFGPTTEEPSATVPEPVVTACLMIASRLWDRRQSPGGVLGSGELGVIRVTGVDRDVEQLLMAHREIWGVV